MEIINIEKSAYEMMMMCFESFTNRVGELCKMRGDLSLKDWLDNQDVCAILNISKRTLQTYRDNGTIAYSQIGHKIYYRSEDVKKMIDNHKTR